MVIAFTVDVGRCRLRPRAYALWIRDACKIAITKHKLVDDYISLNGVFR